MIQKITVLSLIFFIATSIKAMDFGVLKEMEYSLVANKSACLISSSVAAALLVASPENSAIANYLYSGGILIGLDLLGLRKHLIQIALPLFYASTIAAQTKDLNRSIPDHIRSLCAGGVLYTGLREVFKNVYNQDIKRSLIGLGACALGASLLSYKDIKIFFNTMRGKSLNPSKEMKKDSMIYESDSMVEVKGGVLELARAGKLQSRPLFYRLGALIKNLFISDEDSLVSKKLTKVNRVKFVTEVLPHLRAYEIKEDYVVVGNGFSVKTDMLSKDLLKGYFPQKYLIDESLEKH